MADYTIDDYKRAAKKAYAAGNVAAAEELAQAGMALQAQAAEPVEEIDTPLEYAKDIGGAALAGAGRGLMGTLELPEMAARGVARLGQEGLQALGYDVGEDIAVMDTGTGRGLDRVAEAIGIDDELDYRGQTRAGKFAGTIGEFTGGGGAVGLGGKMLKGGAKLFGASGGKVSKLGAGMDKAGTSTRALTAAAISGAGSEAAGQLAEDTMLETPARIAGAFLAPAAAVKAINTGNKTLNAVRNRNAHAPTVQSLKAEKNYAYDQVKNSGQGFDVNETQNMVNKAVRSAFDKGAFSATDDATMEAVNLLESLRGQSINLAQHDKLVRKLGKIYNKAKDQPEILTIIKSMDDSLAAKAGSENVVKTARAANAKYAKAMLLEKEFGKIQRKIDSGSSIDVVSRYKSSISKILDNPNKVKFFSPDEVTAMNNIVKGSLPQSAMNIAGKLAPNGNGLMTYLNIATAYINPAFLGLTAASGVSRKISRSQIKSATKQLQDLVAAGGAPKELIDKTFVNSLIIPSLGASNELIQSVEDQQ